MAAGRQIVGSIDIAIPSYQYGAYLRDAAMSVLSQPFSNLRLLIIDNASTDESQDIARELAASDDRVTLFLNEANRGLFDSYNRAIDWATADYFKLLDADDLLAMGSLELSVKFLDENPDVAFLYGVEGRLANGRLDAGRCDARTTKWEVIAGQEYIRQTCRDSFCDIGAPALIIRTSALKKAGHYRQELPRTTDFELYLRLAMHGKVARTNRVLGVRRIHREQLSHSQQEDRILDFIEHEKAFDLFFDREGGDLADAEELRALAHRRIGDYAYWYGMARLFRRSGDGRRVLGFAAKYRHAPPLMPPLGFLVRKRWIRSLYRRMKSAVHGNPVMPDSYTIPVYL